MRIGGLNGANGQVGQMGGTQASDPVSKNIQKQIAEKQKQLQELSSNEEMTMEEKMKKRQEIQKEITDLNSQLRQHQMEQRKEKQQAQGSTMDDMLGYNKNTGAQKGGQKGAGISKAGMKAMFSADSAMNQAQVQGSVATDMEGRAGILEGEIRMDVARGGDVQKKQEELAKVQQKAQQATTSQVSNLAEANQTLKEAAKEDPTEDTKQTEDYKDVIGQAQVKNAENNGAKTESESVEHSVASKEGQQTDYPSIDIRL